MGLVIVLGLKSYSALSPGFFRDELELGMRICGCEGSLKDSKVMVFSTLVFNPLLDLLEEL